MRSENGRGDTKGGNCRQEKVREERDSSRLRHRRRREWWFVNMLWGTKIKGTRVWPMLMANDDGHADGQ